MFKKIIIKINEVDKGTIIRTVTLIAALINQVVAIIGSTSYANALWYQILSIVATVITSLISMWENNDWSIGAKWCTKLLDAFEDGKITLDELKEIVEDAEKKKEEDKE